MAVNVVKTAVQNSVNEVGERRKAGYIDPDGAVLIIGNTRIPVSEILQAGDAGRNVALDRKTSSGFADIYKALHDSAINPDTTDASDIKGFDTDHEVSPIAFITIENPQKNKGNNNGPEIGG